MPPPCTSRREKAADSSAPCGVPDYWTWTGSQRRRRRGPGIGSRAPRSPPVGGGSFHECGVIDTLSTLNDMCTTRKSRAWTPYSAVYRTILRQILAARNDIGIVCRRPEAAVRAAAPGEIRGRGLRRDMRRRGLAGFGDFDDGGGAGPESGADGLAALPAEAGREGEERPFVSGSLALPYGSRHRLALPLPSVAPNHS